MSEPAATRRIDHARATPPRRRPPRPWRARWPTPPATNPPPLYASLARPARPRWCRCRLPTPEPFLGSDLPRPARAWGLVPRLQSHPYCGARPTRPVADLQPCLVLRDRPAGASPGACAALHRGGALKALAQQVVSGSQAPRATLADDREGLISRQTAHFGHEPPQGKAHRPGHPTASIFPVLANIKDPDAAAAQ